MSRYVATVHFLDSHYHMGDKGYNYYISEELLQQVRSALVNSAFTAFNIVTDTGDTYRNAYVVITGVTVNSTVTISLKTIKYITPKCSSFFPKNANISPIFLAQVIAKGKSYTNNDGFSQKTEDRGLWQLFKETQEAEPHKYEYDGKPVTSIRSLEDEIREAKKTIDLRDIVSTPPTSPIWNMKIPANGPISITQINPIQKEKSTMFDNIMKDMYFGPYKNKDVRLSMQGMAVKTPEGRFNAYNASTGALTDVTGFLMDDFGDVFYALPVAQKELKVGDVILHNKAPVIVTQIGATFISVIDPSRGEELKKIPAKSMFGFDFYSKIMNVMEGLMGTASEDKPFGMLPMAMLMSNGGDGDTESLMKVMVMSQMLGANGNTPMNPLLMFALMGDKGGDNSMMKYFVFAEMMKQGDFATGGMFNPTVATPVTSAASTGKAPDVRLTRTDE